MNHSKNQKVSGKTQRFWQTLEKVFKQTERHKINKFCDEWHTKSSWFLCWEGVLNKFTNYTCLVAAGLLCTLHGQKLRAARQRRGSSEAGAKLSEMCAPLIFIAHRAFDYRNLISDRLRDFCGTQSRFKKKFPAVARLCAYLFLIDILIPWHLTIGI